MKTWCRLLHSLCLPLGFLASLVGLHAQGGPPMLTDDPGTPGDGHWEINTAVTTEQRPGERSSEPPLLDLNYGIGDRIQLKYEAAWVRMSQHWPAHGAQQLADWRQMAFL